MGLMSKLLGGGSRSTDDYVSLTADDFGAAVPDVERSIQIATISNKADIIEIKDAVYDGDVVIADITRHSTTDRTMEQISDELKQVAREVSGDIVQKDDDQIIITPGGIQVSRSKIGS